MKKIIYLTLLVLPSLVFSQTLSFTYDESGNQTKRSLNKYRNAIPPVEKTIEKDFVVYPNPTRGPVTLRWTEEYLGEVKSIRLADMAGRKEKIEFKENVTEVDVDMTMKVDGIYIVNFYLSDGTRVDKKILKQN